MRLLGLHLVITNSLLVSRRHLLATRALYSRSARQRLTCSCRRLHESLSSNRELRVRCAVAVHSPVALSTARAAALILRLTFHIVVGYMPFSTFGVLDWNVGWLGGDGDDVPGVYKTG